MNDTDRIQKCLFIFLCYNFTKNIDPNSFVGYVFASILKTKKDNSSRDKYMIYPHTRQKGEKTKKEKQWNFADHSKGGNEECDTDPCEECDERPRKKNENLSSQYPLNMNRRHPEITGDQRMKNGGGEKKRRWGEEVMDMERERKYVHQYVHHHQKKVEEQNTVVQQSPKLNVERNDTSDAANVAKELSSNRFLVQLWHENNSDNITTSVNYRRFVDKIEEEDEDNLSVSDEDSEDEHKKEQAPETEITHSASDNSVHDSKLDKKKVYQKSAKMNSTSNNIANGSRTRQHSKSHHHNRSHNSRRPLPEDDMGEGPASMIIMSQHHMMSNNGGDEDNNRIDSHDEQQLYSLQSHYGQNNMNNPSHKQDNERSRHHRHGGHKHRSNSHAHGERKHMSRRNQSSDNNISDPEKNLLIAANNTNNNQIDNNDDSNYKPNNNGVFSSKSIKQSNRHSSNANNNSLLQTQYQHPPSHLINKSSKPTTMAELNAKRSKYQLRYIGGQMIGFVLVTSATCHNYVTTNYPRYSLFYLVIFFGISFS